jgi:hypothetical protein
MEESKQGNVIDLVAEAAAAPAITMFKINNNPYTCQAAVNKLREIKRSSNLDGWNSFEVCTDGEGVSQTPKLRCKHCTVLFAVSNPSQTLKTHLTARACTGLKRQGFADAAAAAAAAAEEGTSGGGAAAASSSAVSSGKRKKDGGGVIMCATAHQQQCFEKSIARFFFKNAIPLQLTDDPDLRAAVGHVGLVPPTRRALSNKLLEEEFNAVRAMDLDRLAQAKFIQISSDGWRRKAAVGGQPLINFVALLATGKPIFWKVLSAAGEVKDQHWIAARHLEVALEITGGDLSRVVGFNMDNTKANM